MKKSIALILTLILSLTALISCQQPENNARVKINIGVMSGPTGMGMAMLMNESSKSDSDLYSFDIYSAPTNATADLASGALDMLCLPTNTAAALATKQADYVTVIAVNCLGSLYLVSNESIEISSINDLEGQTIYASVPSSTTGPIIEFILERCGVNATIEFEADHDTLVAKIKSGEAPIAVLPEPKVTAALMQNSAYEVDLNLSEEWDKVSDLPLAMGCIVVRNDFLKENEYSVKQFLIDYKKSIAYINAPENLDSSAQMIVDAQILPKLPIAKGALSNLYGSIVYLDGEEMKNALEGFYEAIGLTSPGNDFYYEQ